MIFLAIAMLASTLAGPDRWCWDEVPTATSYRIYIEPANPDCWEAPITVDACVCQDGRCCQEIAVTGEYWITVEACNSAGCSGLQSFDRQPGEEDREVCP